MAIRTVTTCDRCKREVPDQKHEKAYCLTIYRGSVQTLQADLCSECEIMVMAMFQKKDNSDG